MFYVLTHFVTLIKDLPNNRPAFMSDTTLPSIKKNKSFKD